MGNSTSIQERGVADALSVKLKQNGFDWLPRLHQFRRSTEKGFSCLILSSSPATEGIMIEAHIGLRLDAVENLAFPFTNGLPGFQPDSMTIVAPLANLYGKRFQLLNLKNEKDQVAAAKLFITQFEDKGLPFIEEYNELSELNQLFNLSPSTTLSIVHNQINRCFRGLVIAKLSQSPDFEKIAEAYQQMLTNKLYATDQAVQKFERLKWFLQHYSMN